jgi:hypothetical protein
MAYGWQCEVFNKAKHESIISQVIFDRDSEGPRCQTAVVQL